MKKFFKTARALPVDDGFEIRLDETVLRHMKTKEPFVLPSSGLAEAVAAEWNGANGEFSLSDMPLTCFLMGALVLNDEQKQDIREKIFECACCDTLCCFVDTPADLRALQNEKWLPVVEKINEAGADFRPSDSLCGREISEKNKDFLKRETFAADNVSLACFQQLSAIFSSVLLAAAVMKKILPVKEAFA